MYLFSEIYHIPLCVQRTGRYLLLNLRHPDIVFRQIIRKGDILIVHKPQHITTTGGITNRWNIRHRMKFILESPTRRNEGKVAAGRRKTRSVQKGNERSP